MSECKLIEKLLEEVHDHVDAADWDRIARAVGGIVKIYGVGLTNALEHARRAGVDESDFGERLADDELLAGLLVLHEIHPLSTEARVRRAVQGLDEIVDVTLIGDRVELCSASTIGPELASYVRTAISIAAPEVRSVEIVDMRLAC